MSASSSSAASRLSQTLHQLNPFNPSPVMSANIWSSVPQGPADPIIGVSDRFKADPSPVKINLGVGAYRDDNGKPYVLPTVQKADEFIQSQHEDKEYLPITGLAKFNQEAIKLAYGADSAPYKEGRIAVTQSISGTGALRIGSVFLSRFYPGAKTFWVPTPTYGNHNPIIKDSGLDIKQYRYYDNKTGGLDFEGMKEDLQNAPNGAIVMLHACAHNPTGVDPTKEQWKELSKVFTEKGHFAFFDMAYQGFASGSVDDDAFAPRHFVSEGHLIMLCQSFAKNMGLYGERAGTFSMVCGSKEDKAKVDSQIKIIVRPLYSNPPVHGARIAAHVLSTPELFDQWLVEVKGMADRIIRMRTSLYDLLVNELGSKQDWTRVKSQIGMFCFTGLTEAQVARLADEFHVYMTKDGRISIAGITPANVRHLAESMHEVTK